MDNQPLMLIVDDIEVNRAILTELFCAKFQILEACNGKEAIDLLIRNPDIAIVLLDIVMPQMNGYEVLKIKSNEPSIYDIPVIVMTQPEDEASEIEVLALGAVDFIAKPYHPQIIAHRVYNAVLKHKLENDLVQQEMDTRLNSILDHVASGIGIFEVIDDKVKAIYLNPGFYKMIGYTQGEYEPFKDNVLQIVVPEDAAKIIDLVWKSFQTDAQFDTTYRAYRPDGTLMVQQLHALLISLGGSDGPVFLTSMYDITQLANTETTLKKTTMEMQALMNSIPGGIAILEIADKIRFTYFNDTLPKLAGYTNEEFSRLFSDNMAGLLINSEANAVIDYLHKANEDNQLINYSFPLLTKDGGINWIKLCASKMEERQETSLFYAVFIDINAEKANEFIAKEVISEMKYRAEHDMLTGLSNRKNFSASTASMLKLHLDTKYYLISYDIERFKIINDLFGTKLGDKVLLEISSTLQNLCKNIGTCARIEGDHFVFCLPRHKLDIHSLVHKMDTALAHIVKNYKITSCYGIYPIDDIEIPVDQMCDRANLALQTIKGNYLNRFAYYDETLRNTILQEQQINSEMNDALLRREFCVHFQPIYCVATGKPTSAEALVRWQHPTKGMISPSLFIPLFERNGFITKLDFFVWERTCQYLRAQKNRNRKVLPISVNISRMNFYNTNLCNEIIALVKKYHLEPTMLKLEITESAYTDNATQLLSAMQTLQEYGFEILMDDFGSGYSSLNLLKDVPVNTLKIDMDFLEDFKNSSRSASIVTAVVHMSKSLGMCVVAEGVENKLQFDFLNGINCDQVQGFYFSKPLPADQYEELLHAAYPQ